MLVMTGRWFRVCCVSILKTVMQQDNLMICPFLLSRLLLVIPNLFSSLLFPSLPFPSIVPTAQQKRDRKLAFL